MANVIRVGVDGVEDLLNAGMYGTGAIVRLQSGPTETGAFTNEATATLVAATRIYTLYDADGTSSTWYRTRYENVGGTSTSDWSPAFQVGPEEGGGICSLYDVKQALGRDASDTSSDEELSDLIGEITTDIVTYTGRRFVRSPLSGTATLLFDVARDSRTLRIPQGIATVTSLAVATQTQPESGGTYVTVPTTEWWLRPVAQEREAGFPATSIVISDLSGSYFACGYNTVQAVMAIGWATVPADIGGIGRRGVIRRFKNRAAATVNRGGDPQDVMARWTFSLEEQRKLDWYRVPKA